MSTGIFKEIKTYDIKYPDTTEDFVTVAQAKNISQLTKADDSATEMYNPPRDFSFGESGTRLW